MGNTFKQMLMAVNPIAFACYYSVSEYANIVLDYVYTILNVNELVYNVIHNAGFIYDAVTALINTFRYGDPSQRAYWQSIGGSIGFVVN